MKKYILMLLLAAGAVSGGAMAQVQKDVVYLGGAIRFNGAADRNESASDRTITKIRKHYMTPEVQWGKFLSNSTMAGIGVRYNLGINRLHSEFSQINIRETVQSIHLLPFIRQYKSLNSRWAVFLHGEVGPEYEWSVDREKGDFPSKSTDERWRYGLSIKPGVVYQLPKKKWALEAYANVLSLDARYSPSKNDTPGVFSLNTGITTGFPNYFTIRIARHFSSQN